MARTNQVGVAVVTSTLLKQVQKALIRAKAESDPELKQAAENVLSALIVVLRHPTAELPAKLKPFIDKVTRET